MDEKRLDIPFVNPPMFRMIFKILESHEKDGITVIDKMEIERFYVVPPDSTGEIINSSASTGKEEPPI